MSTLSVVATATRAWARAGESPAFRRETDRDSAARPAWRRNASKALCNRADRDSDRLDLALRQVGRLDHGHQPRRAARSVGQRGETTPAAPRQTAAAGRDDDARRDLSRLRFGRRAQPGGRGISPTNDASDE